MTLQELHDKIVVLIQSHGGDIAVEVSHDLGYVVAEPWGIEFEDGKIIIECQ